MPHSLCCSPCCSSHNLPITFSPQYAVDCNDINSLPTITFIISGARLPLSPSAYVLKVCITLLGPRGPAESPVLLSEQRCSPPCTAVGSRCFPRL